jgi:DNA-binding NtrC family response regulator
MNKTQKKQILVVAQPDELSRQLSGWIAEAVDFELQLTPTDEQAIEMFHQQSFDMVLVDGDSNDPGFRKLKAILPIFQHEVLVISTEAASAEELDEKVKEVFEIRKRRRIQRLLVLDAAETPTWNGMPLFSPN